MSAIGGKADIAQASRMFAYDPKQTLACSRKGGFLDRPKNGLRLLEVRRTP